MNVRREKLVRPMHGMMPAKLADVVSRLKAPEIPFALFISNSFEEGNLRLPRTWL
jgi:propanediol dehydratase large subunit